MPYEQVSAGDRSELTSIIREIRNRWRLKLAVRGAAFVVGGFLLTLLLSAYALETLKFSPGSIIAFRVGMVMVFGALAGYAQIHVRLENYEKALDYARRAVAVNPNLDGTRELIEALEAVIAERKGQRV